MIVPLRELRRQYGKEFQKLKNLMSKTLLINNTVTVSDYVQLHVHAVAKCEQ